MSLISCPTPRPWRDRLMPLAAALLLAACAAPSPQLAPPIARHAASAAFSDGIGMRFVRIPAGEQTPVRPGSTITFGRHTLTIAE